MEKAVQMYLHPVGKMRSIKAVGDEFGIPERSLRRAI